jgi:hydroxyacylglutathione hydrolase
MKIKIYNLQPEFGTNTYLIWDENSREAVLIDAAAPDRLLIDDIKRLELDLKYLFLTHGHSDHIAGIGLLKDVFGVPIGIHELDAEMLTDAQKNLSVYWNQNIVTPPAEILFQDGDIFPLGKFEIKVIHTPGHTQGGVCFLIDDLLISGDTLFAESIGRADLPGGDFQTLKDSIQNRIFALPDATIVYPGHGPKTSVEDEKVGNPFVGILT